MKKIIPILLALLLLVGLLSTSAFADEEKTDTITFEQVTTKKSDNGLFTLTAYWFNDNGWAGGTDTHYITISASEGLLITGIKATLTHYSSDYGRVGISGGMKQEGEIWEDGCIVTVKDINASEFSFIGGKDWCSFQDITVYYTGKHVHNYQRITTYVCSECNKAAPEGYVPEGGTGSTLSEGNMAIIVGVASAVVFGFGGFLLGKKKKQTPANVGGNDEE